jgi:hypothetical protein
LQTAANDGKGPKQVGPKQVWVGLLGVEPVAGCDILGGDNVVGAYVYFLVAAQSDDEFRAIASKTVEVVRA